jgi:hypothetical protein
MAPTLLLVLPEGPVVDYRWTVACTPVDVIGIVTEQPEI